MPDARWNFQFTEEGEEKNKQEIQSLTIPRNFEQTVVPYDPSMW